VILALLLLGTRNRGVALYLGCSERCARNQIKHMYRVIGIPRYGGGIMGVVALIHSLVVS